MKDQTVHIQQIILIMFCMLVSLLLAACGQSQATPDEPASAPPTLTPLPALNFEQPTTMIQESSPEATEENVPVTPEGDVDLARGERIYNDKSCGDCHGAQGEGVEGQATALAGTSLTEEAFIDILRTGGKGELGNDHLYGTQAISPSGMEALYAYVTSLPEP